MTSDQGGLLVVAGVLGALPLLAHLLLVRVVGLRAFLLDDGFYQLIWAGVGLVAGLLFVRAARGTRLPLGLALALWAVGAALVYMGRQPLLPLLGAHLLLIGFGIYGMTKRP
jgi:hypothetical protein